MTDKAGPDTQDHPQWCDRAQCTVDKPRGSHCSTTMILGPLPYTKLIVKASVFAIDGMPVPAAMVSFHLPLTHPQDIAEAGTEEDMLSVILHPDQIAQLSTFVNGLHEVVAA